MSRYGLLLTRVVFHVAVGHVPVAQSSAPQSPVALNSRQCNLRSAFASYATSDRADVLARVQGIRAAGIDVFVDAFVDVFVDMLALRAGDNWERELRRAIDDRDVLYLFWSSAALAPEWVDREWRMALAARGTDFI